VSKHEVWQQLTRGLIAKGWLSIVVPVVNLNDPSREPHV